MPRLGPAVPLVLAVLVGLGAAPPSPRYEVVPGSHVWIDGTATTGRWTCAADEVRGHGLVSDRARLDAQGAVRVRDFDCGSGPMNRDLYRALAAEAHPTIDFELTRAATDPAAVADRWAPVTASGTLRIAGVARPITVSAEGRRLPDGRVALRGEKRLRMSDFGVEPPSHALGLVRAHDPIVARFTLYAVAR